MEILTIRQPFLKSTLLKISLIEIVRWFLINIQEQKGIEKWKDSFYLTVYNENFY